MNHVETIKLSTTVGELSVFIHHSKLTSRRTIINLHGSGFIFAHEPSDTVFCRRISQDTQSTVFDVDYPLAPQHPFSEPLNAVYEVIKMVQPKYQNSLGPVVLIGHSAGGNLVVGSQILAERRRQPKVSQVILDYPALDLDTDPRDKPFPKGASSIISPRLAASFNEAYNPTKIMNNPLISPVLAKPTDLINFPNTFIATADHDSLMPEAEHFGELLAGAGNTVNVHRYSNSLHGFTIDRTGAAEQAALDIIHTVNN